MTTGRLLSGLIFVAVALILGGFALAMVFEAAAILTGKESTISQLASGTIRTHWPLALLATFGIGVLIGALIQHFTAWTA